MITILKFLTVSLSLGALVVKKHPPLKKHRGLYFTILFTIFFSIRISAQDTTEISNYSVIDNSNLREQVVATVDDIIITAEEFLNSYEFGPAFAKRQSNSKRKYLDFMIYEKLLALDGYSSGLDSADDVNKSLYDVVGDLSTEQLYRDLIWENIEISDDEIDDAVAKENITLSVKWIYKPAYNEIQNIYIKLTQGKSFDSLFNNQFTDTSVYFDNRILETTKFKLEHDNPLLAGIVNNLQPGSFSKPIKTEDGYYIFELDNIWTNTIITETELRDLRYSLNRALKKQKADAVSDSFVNQLLFNEKPVIARNSFNIIKAFVGQKYLSPDVFSEWEMTKGINDIYLHQNKVNIFKAQDDTLIRLNKNHILVKDFLDWYSTRELYIRFNLVSHQAFFESLQQIVWRMLRDYLLTQLAYKRNFQNDKEVIMQQNWWKDKIVYSKVKQQIIADIKFDDEKINEYYISNLNNYKDIHGNSKSFNEVKDEVRNDYYVYEYTKKIVTKILTLKKKFKIDINENLLNKLEVLDENNPGTVDVYSVKKGGTFVRPVYPVIDYEWQFWN